MKELIRDKKHPLFLQIAQEYGKLKLDGHRPNRLIINKSLKNDLVVKFESIFPELQIFFTDDAFDFSFEQVFETYKFIK